MRGWYKAMKEIKKAVALKYDPNKEKAPRVVAKGAGDVAARIVEEGTKHDVAIQQDDALIQLLYQLELNEQIPPKLYPVIAEVFALVYRAEQMAGNLSDR